MKTLRILLLALPILCVSGQPMLAQAVQTPAPQADSSAQPAQSPGQATQVSAQPGPKPAQAIEDSATAPSEGLIRLIFIVGISSITLSWIIIPALFAYRGELDQLYRLVRQGAVIKFITITYIVLVIVTLGLTGHLKDDKISTLLAAILGYILGEAGGRATDSGASDSSKSRGLPHPNDRQKLAQAAAAGAGEGGREEI